ncbi:FUSC family protein [Halomonas halocynthiae]|uniref:FUSC family protein n=1 Tax=Halomonas halocynthiae TaxID=176290 RepID=UPI0003F86864|nr:FUSC family protein [Halomonas halocynthiae]
MWLKNLLKLTPAKWPVNRSVRISLGLGIPLTLGYFTDHALIFMWMAIAVMLQSSGEGVGSYRSLFRNTFISSLIGCLGFLAGYLWFLPSITAIIILSFLAFIAGIVNSYGAAYSKGTLQALLTASVTYGLAPELHAVIAFWKISGLFLLGTLFYALLLATEALIDKRRPQRQQLAEYLSALSALAAARSSGIKREADNKAIEEKRRVAIDKYNVLYGMLLDHRSANTTRSKENKINADILQAGDAIFSSVLANNNTKHLSAAASWLQAAAQSVQHHHRLPACPATQLPDSRLGERIIDLSDSLIVAGSLKNHTSSQTAPIAPFSARHRTPALALSHLIVGPEVISVAAKLALCMGLAFSAQFVVHSNHWYWVPLTVSLVMRPELGSVFVRAVLRTLGTTIGVIIGTVMLMVIPKGSALLIALVILASCMPWAMLKSYALLSVFITPLVLILVDLVAPGTATINYAGQRLTDTAIGGGIVLIFGYFIWPKTHEKQLSGAYTIAMKTMSDYFLMACRADPDASKSLRFEVYSKLSNLRIQLQRQLSEPPPANKEAAQWFPVIVATERLADRITIYIENTRPDESPLDHQCVELLATHMQMITTDHHRLKASEPPSDNPFLNGIIENINTLSRQLAALKAASPT